MSMNDARPRHNGRITQHPKKREKLAERNILITVVISAGGIDRAVLGICSIWKNGSNYDIASVEWPNRSNRSPSLGPLRSLLILIWPQSLRGPSGVITLIYVWPVPE